MKLEVTFRNLEATEAIRERAEKKLARMTKHLREPVAAHLVLSVQRYRHIAELTVSSADGNFHVEEETDDLYATVDQLAQRVERLVQRHHEKASERGPGIKSLLPEDETAGG